MSSKTVQTGTAIRHASEAQSSRAVRSERGVPYGLHVRRRIGMTPLSDIAVALTDLMPYYDSHRKALIGSSIGHLSGHALRDKFRPFLKVFLSEVLINGSFSVG
jgi:hypothetical protein